MTKLLGFPIGDDLHTDQLNLTYPLLRNISSQFPKYHFFSQGFSPWPLLEHVLVLRVRLPLITGEREVIND